MQSNSNQDVLKMIEQNIQDLRKAAKVSTSRSSDKIWCAIAGNEEGIDDLIYEAHSLGDRVKIVHREHTSFRDSYIEKKFDFIMLYGDQGSIRELSSISKDRGCAYIQIAPYYAENEENLMLFVSEEERIVKFVADLEKNNIDTKLILKDNTTGFIDTDVVLTINLPKIIKTIVDPLFKMADIVLTTMLLSINEKDEEKIKKIANLDKIYSIKFDDIMEE